MLDKFENLLQKIRQADKKYSLFFKGQKILVGLSGGADSVCLVHALKSLSREYGFSLAALHINHLIRGKEAFCDEEFAKKLCQRLSVDFYCERIDVPAIAKETKQSLELCARNQRYLTFEKICSSLCYDTIATAHNANDCAETLLLNLTRGCSLKGLCSIPPKRTLSDSCSFSVIRPLIMASRPEIEDYLGAVGESFVTDSTNACDDYTRNFIRHNILPQFLTLNPAFVRNTRDLCDTLRRDSEFIEDFARRHFSSNIQELSEFDPTIQARIIRRLYNEACGGKYLLEKKHIDDICRNLKNQTLGVSLPGKIKCVNKDGMLCFIKDTRQKQEYTGIPVPLKAEFTHFYNNQYLICIKTKKIDESLEKHKNSTQLYENIYKIVNTDYIYSDTILCDLYARTRNHGDKIRQNGMQKSIKRLFCEKNVPPDERNILPFICNDKEIVYIPHLGISENYRRRESSRFVTQITIFKKSDNTFKE